MDSHYLILAGDFNCCLSNLDRSSTYRLHLTKVAQTIQLFLRTFGVCDAWCFLNPTSRSYSFFSHVHKTYSRIDYFFLDKNIIPLITKCDYNAIVISDHAPLSLALQIPTSQTSYRSWRFNNQWLAEDEFVEYISRKINLFLKTNRTQGMSNSII